MWYLPRLGGTLGASLGPCTDFTTTLERPVCECVKSDPTVGMGSQARAWKSTVGPAAHGILHAQHE